MQPRGEHASLAVDRPDPAHRTPQHRRGLASSVRPYPGRSRPGSRRKMCWIVRPRDQAGELFRERVVDFEPVSDVPTYPLTPDADHTLLDPASDLPRRNSKPTSRTRHRILARCRMAIEQWQ